MGQFLTDPVNGAEHVARAGQTIVVPAGVPHSGLLLGEQDVIPCACKASSGSWGFWSRAETRQ
jgi:quercetin dioxygenase-like cupin family protein